MGSGLDWQEAVQGSGVSGKRSHLLPKVLLGPVVLGALIQGPALSGHSPAEASTRGQSTFPPLLGGLIKFPLCPDQLGKEEGREKKKTVSECTVSFLSLYQN